MFSVSKRNRICKKKWLRIISFAGWLVSAAPRHFHAPRNQNSWIRPWSTLFFVINFDKWVQICIERFPRFVNYRNLNNLIHLLRWVAETQTQVCLNTGTDILMRSFRLKHHVVNGLSDRRIFGPVLQLCSLTAIIYILET